ncbi:DNA helicase UvrD [Candidatus Woesearchaeota archaeon]|nr:DNA helicase UvrD [Candidatus Woesearchaeota archaeon]
MKVITDLHIHSRYARACSKDLSIKTLSKYAKIKGVDILGTGDFQHPEWIKELKKELTEVSQGIFESKDKMKFMLTTEISLMYSQEGKGRRIHLVTLAPSFEVVDQIIDTLSKKGRLDYDGRPIFGMSCIDYVDMMMKISKDIEIIPGHAWTPWFGVFGSKSGFDSLKECFQEKTKHIHAIETGISSTPDMNWRLSKLDNISIVSFSDLHSYWPHRLGREATVFDIDNLSYNELLERIRNNEKFETIEFFPEEGKYHYDGHRNCGVVASPAECKKLKGICPNCKKPLTIGVAHRIEELADRPEGYKPKNAKPFTRLIPLLELISASIGTGVSSKKTFEVYYKLIKAFSNEYNILLNVKEHELENVVDKKIIDLIIKNRSGKINFIPGYDGVYGHPVFEGVEVNKKEIKPVKKEQKSLEEF